MKAKYYYIWIEGIAPRSGEKIQSINNGRISYTLKITRAMRIRTEHKEKMKSLLLDLGIEDWCVNSSETFVPTSYAPPGSIYTF